jgi:hypothetical protein
MIVELTAGKRKLESIEPRKESIPTTLPHLWPPKRQPISHVPLQLSQQTNQAAEHSLCEDSKKKTKQERLRTVIGGDKSMSSEQESEATNRVFLENVFDGMVDKAIMDVQNSFHSPNPKDFWNDLQKLAIIIRDPPDVHNKFMKFIKQTEMEEERSQSYLGLTWSDRTMHQFKVQGWLRKKGLELMDMEFQALQDSGYFTRRARRIQSNVGRGQLFETRP